MSEAPSVKDLRLTATEREALHSLIAKRGDVRTAAAVNVSRNALLRALAGLECRRGTIVLLRTGLARIATESASTDNPPAVAAAGGGR